MTTVAPPVPAPGAAPFPAAPDLEARVRELGRRIAAGQATAGRSRSRALEDRGMELLSRDPALRAALFRLVDVAPACAGRRDLAAHLASLLGEVQRPVAPAEARGLIRAAVPFARGASLRPASGVAVGSVAGIAVQRMAKRFIVGQGPGDAVPALARLWRAGAAASVDLLGEATVTAAEADHYAARCDEALRTLAAAARAWPPHATLDAAPRVNLSLKGTALTP